MQQIMDAVAVYALMPLFKAKILPHQYASIKIAAKWPVQTKLQSGFAGINGADITARLT